MATTVGCIIVLILLPSVFSSAVAVLAAPVSIVKTWAVQSTASLPQYLRNRSGLINEISDLEEKLAVANGASFTVDGLAKENAELRSLLGYEGQERILAGIIGKPGVLPYDVLMLDRGTHEGVYTGAPVYIGEHTVIGIVRNATAHTALVELITSPGFEATVYIVGPDIYTNAVGIGGGQLRVGVPQGIVLSEGDQVVLPSVASGIYGEISVVQSEASRPEQYGYVSPEISIASLRHVAVGKTPLQSISFQEAQSILSDIKSTVFTVPVPAEILVDTEVSTTSVENDEYAE